MLHEIAVLRSLTKLSGKCLPRSHFFLPKNRPCNFSKKDLNHRCFHVHFKKYLGHLFYWTPDTWQLWHHCKVIEKLYLFNKYIFRLKLVSLVSCHVAYAWVESRCIILSLKLLESIAKRFWNSLTTFGC